jgi:hypothetical protein
MSYSFLNEEQQSLSRSAHIHDPVLTLIRSIEHYFLLGLRRDISRYPLSYSSISQGNERAILDVVKLLILAQVECDQSDIFLPSILQLSETTKAYIAGIVEGFKNDDRVRYVEFMAGGDFSSMRMDVSTAVGIEYDKESKQHFADKDKMIEDQNKLISTLQARIDEMTARHESTERVHASERQILETKNRELTTQLVSLEERLIQTEDHPDEIAAYRKNIAYLEDRVRDLTESNQGIPELKSQINMLMAQLKELEGSMGGGDHSITQKEKELADFMVSGGSLGGGIRDRVIATLQQQLVLREQEINFHRDERNRGTEHHKKTEKLLVSAIHSIALRYHEEMVATCDSGDLPMNHLGDQSSQADSMYGS